MFARLIVHPTSPDPTSTRTLAHTHAHTSKRERTKTRRHMYGMIVCEYILPYHRRQAREWYNIGAGREGLGVEVRKSEEVRDG